MIISRIVVLLNTTLLTPLTKLLLTLRPRRKLPNSPHVVLSDFGGIIKLLDLAS